MALAWQPSKRGIGRIPCPRAFWRPGPWVSPARWRRTDRPRPRNLAACSLCSTWTPLSGLDPATREIAQTRLLAERALYIAHRMPNVLRWQTELLALTTTEMPAARQLVTNSTQIAESLDRFSRVAEALPGQIRTEREEIVKALESQVRAENRSMSEVSDGR